MTFQGDRLEEWYRNLPGQWDRIWILPGSFDNEINYTIIKNGNIGIQVDTIANNNPTLSTVEYFSLRVFSKSIALFKKKSTSRENGLNLFNNFFSSSISLEP